jgi:hypothetical protein
MYLAVFAGLLLMVPIAAGAAYAADTSKSPPPIGQNLVREGDYAVKLAQALKLGPATTEADSENALVAVGIAPESGWISDFPITPDIIAELQSSMDEAASSGRLTMSKAEAFSAFQALNAEAGLSVTPGAPEAKITEYSSEDTQGYSEAPAYEDQAAIDSYYAEEGPPVITYYAPPPDYAYLYAWDPFPFWCGGYYFPGYFVLNNFTIFASFDNFGHRRNFGHRGEFGRNWRGHGIISNHVTDRASNRTVSIDPVSRHPRTETSFRPAGARSFEPVSRTSGTRNFTRGSRGGSFDRSSASNIVGRSFNRSANTFVQRDGVMTRRDSNTVVGTGRSFSGTSRSFEGGRSFNGGRRLSGGGSVRSFSGGSRSSDGGSVRSFNGGGRSSGSGFSRGFGGGGRSFDGGSVRSFNGGSRSSGGNSMRSFGGGSHSSGGGFSRGSGGGGHSFGGGGRGFGGGGGHSSGGGGGHGRGR